MTSLRHLVVILGDQLDREGAAFDGFDAACDAVWMAEADEEATHVWSTKPRIAMFIAAMRHFARGLRQAGLPLHYQAFDAAPEGGTLAHVKPHGQLYNQAVKEPELAMAIVDAVRRFDPSLKFFGLAGSGMIEAARRAGFTPVEEVFAGRGYMPDGSLVPRSQPGALIEDEEQSLAQTLSLVRDHQVRAIDGSIVAVNAQSVCLHGDGAHALAFARRIRDRLTAEGIAIRPR